MNYKGSNKFGVLPRRTVIANQPHMLAYINPQEEMLLRQMGGAGEPVGSMGIPAYYFGYGGQEKPDENFGIDNPYAIDITDTNIYTENPDGTYTVEDGEPDPIEMVGDGEGEPPAEYFNLFRSTQPSSWMGNSIWSNYGEGPDFNVDVYQEADGSLRFRENGELVPEEYLKYIKYAKRTEMDAPGEEDVA